MSRQHFRNVGGSNYCRVITCVDRLFETGPLAVAALDGGSGKYKA